VNFTEVYLSLMAMISVVSVHRTSDRRRLELVQSEYMSICMSTYVYIYIYIIHTYIHTYMHACIHT
jgi:hypothetical protein